MPDHVLLKYPACSLIQISPCTSKYPGAAGVGGRTAAAEMMVLDIDRSPTLILISRLSLLL